MYTKFLLLWTASLLVTSADQLEVNEKLIGSLLHSFEESSSLPESHSTTTKRNEKNKLLNELYIIPSRIDFGTWSIGQPRTQTIMLLNEHSNHSVQLNSISGQSLEFYSSFFEKRELLPKSNTTFNVVFLPRQIGAISSQLLIHTSFGNVEIKVKGNGQECPYRLKPLVGIKASINATLTPEIHMYNPHERPLQIIEVYSSGGEFKLELPSGGQEGPQNLWEIPPFTIKPIIRICFQGRTAGNHTTYIRIKIAEPTDEALQFHENVLVIPVEFEIQNVNSPYARNPIADFGYVSTEYMKPLRFQLDMINNTAKHLIASYTRELPGLTFDATNSSIILNPKLFEKSTTLDELVTIRCYNESSNLSTAFTVIVRADIYKGGLNYEHNITTFITISEPFEAKRTVTLFNDFRFPVFFLNATWVEPVDASQMRLEIVLERCMIHPDQSVELLRLHLKNRNVKMQATLRIVTNATTLFMPVIVCPGKLHVSTLTHALRMVPNPSYNTEVNLGAIPFAEMSHEGYVIINNYNPVPIDIVKWSFKKPQNVYYNAFFLGCLRAKVVAQYLERNTTIPTQNGNFSFCTELDPGDVAIFKLSIQTYLADLDSHSIIIIRTPYEVITTKLRFRTTIGQVKVEQDQLNFRNCFPGRICSAALSIRSSFNQPMHISNINFTLPGLRFRDFNAKGTRIAPQTVTKVGRIYFDAAAACGDFCYLNRHERNMNVLFPTVETLKSSGGNNNLLYNGMDLLRRTDKYRQLKRQLTQIGLTLHSRELQPLVLEFAIDVVWPKLIDSKACANMPVTEIGAPQRQNVIIRNPSPHALLVDYYLADSNYARDTLITLPTELVDTTSTSNCYLTNQAVFKLPNGAPKKPFILPGDSTISVPVEFNTKQPARHCTLLYVRNNLTLYEAVWISARAIPAHFRFNQRKPGSSTPLLFELTEKNLESCGRRNDIVDPNNDNKTSENRSIVKRSFLARNYGETILRVEQMLIDDEPCEGYGFKINDCVSFELKENGTRKVEIFFSTDFTNSLVVRSLILKINLPYEVKYILKARVPAESLERCSYEIERPVMENFLNKMVVILLTVAFVLVIVAACVDYRIIMVNQSIIYAARYKGPIQPTFNLRNITTRVRHDHLTVDDGIKRETVKAKSSYSNTCSHSSSGSSSSSSSSSSSHLKKRTASNASIPKERKSKWNTWKMDILMPMYGGKDGSKRTKISTNVSSDIKASAVLATSTVTSASPSSKQTPQPLSEPRARKCSQQQQLRSSKKLRHISNVHQSNTKTDTESTPPPTKLLSHESIEVKPVPVVKMVVSSVEEQKSLKEHNAVAPKKLGKTPGRERRKEANRSPSTTNNANESKKSERRQARNRQLDFTEATDSKQCNYEETAINCITSPWETSSQVSFSDVLQINKKLTQENANNDFDWNASNVANTATTELGPIGSKKSQPLSTNTAWNSTNNDTFSGEQTFNGANLNYFTNFDAITSNRLRDLSVDLYELQQAQILQRQWQANEILLRQQQQQILLQQQQQQQQQQQNQQKFLQDMDIANWSTTWSPLAYGAPWQTVTPLLPTGAMMRPPPGLETNSTSGGNAIQENTQPTTLNTASIIENLSMPTQYDPFSSLSSIWSNNWQHTLPLQQPQQLPMRQPQQQQERQQQEKPQQQSDQAQSKADE